MSTTVNVRVDDDVKRGVEVLFDSMGLNVSTAVNMFFKQCLMEEALPFQPKLTRKHIPLKERLKDHNYSGYRTEEWDTGEPVGREVF